MEKGYLDPDTARKLGTVKQQFKIQKDRRKQLLQSVSSVTKTPMYQKLIAKETLASSQAGL